MEDWNLDPVVGEEVRLDGRRGVFKIVHVWHPDEAHPNANLRTVEGSSGTVDLLREDGALRLDGIPWHRLKYVDGTRSVRRVIEWLRTNPEGKVFPSYVVDYEVEAGEDHAGNASIFVRFLVDPEYVYENGRPSEKKIADLNRFLEEVRRELLVLDLDRWLYVRAGEVRRELDVAS
ncbi:MAG: hypothetical protein WCE75_03810 [Terracidiphilus sp.]